MGTGHRLDVTSASGHALQRFREHYPGAASSAVVAAARLALPVPTELAHSLTGRPRAAATPASDRAEHRLHLAGDGLFVICPLPDQPTVGYVKTYLRLGSTLQREMARRWFLEPMGPLRAAFELGYAAGRAATGPDTPARLAAAVEQQVPALLALAPLLGGPMLRDASAPAVAFEWSDSAREHAAWFAASHAAWEADLAAWRWLRPAQLEALASARHCGPLEGATHGRIEPHGLAVALVSAEEAGGPWRVHRLVNVPRADRPAMVAEALPAEGRPPPGSVGEAAPPPTPTPVASEQPTLDLREATGLSIRGWASRACEQAEALGVPRIEPGYLSELEPVPVALLAQVAAALGWRLRPDRAYAARRYRDAVLLLTAQAPFEGFLVDRCGRWPEGFGETPGGGATETP